MAIVEDHEREAAGSATNLGRTVAAATPALTGEAGGRALGPVRARRPAEDIYDPLLWTMFRHVKLTDSALSRARLVFQRRGAHYFGHQEIPTGGQ